MELIREVLRFVASDHLLELRRAMEVRAAGLAARQLSARDATALRRAVQGMRQSAENLERFIEYDIAFHTTIGRGSGNPCFSLIGKGLRECLERSIRAVAATRIGSFAFDSLVEIHAAIAAAIIDGQAAQAEYLMREHFEACRGLDGSAEAFPATRTGETPSRAVAGNVLDFLHDNQMRSGDDVPSEATASADLRVSRAVVREAYRSLTKAGILSARAGRFRVASLTESTLAPLVTCALLREPVSAEQLFELRKSIEVRMAALAARNRRDEDIQELRSIVNRMRKTGATEIERRATYDLAFREVIGRATANPLLELFGSAVRAWLTSSLRLAQPTRNRRPIRFSRQIRCYELIVDAMEEKNAALAEHLLTNHLDEARNTLCSLPASAGPVTVRGARAIPGNYRS